MTRAALLVAMLSLAMGTAAGGAPGPVFKGDPAAVAEVQAVYKKMASIHTWRARTTSFRAGAPVGTSTIEFVAPDRYRVTVASGGRTSEMFRVGKDSWILSGNVCRKVSATFPVPGPGVPQALGADVTVTVARGDPATIDGIPTRTYLLDYEVAYKTASGASKEKVYVATGTGLPRRVERTSSAGTSTTDYDEYNAPITINAPPC